MDKAIVMIFVSTIVVLFYAVLGLNIFRRYVNKSGKVTTHIIIKIYIDVMLYLVLGVILCGLTSYINYGIQGYRITTICNVVIYMYTLLSVTYKLYTEVLKRE